MNYPEERLKNAISKARAMARAEMTLSKMKGLKIPKLFGDMQERRLDQSLTDAFTDDLILKLLPQVRIQEEMLDQRYTAASKQTLIGRLIEKVESLQMEVVQKAQEQQEQERGFESDGDKLTASEFMERLEADIPKLAEVGQQRYDQIMSLSPEELEASEWSKFANAFHAGDKAAMLEVLSSMLQFALLSAYMDNDEAGRLPPLPPLIDLAKL